MNNLESESSFKRIRKQLAIITGAAALTGATVGMGILAFHDDYQEGTASCDGLKVTVLDRSQRLVEVVPSISTSGDAEFIGVTYIFDEGQLSVRNNSVDAVQHDYPDDVTNRSHTITAVADYRLNNEDFGGLPICQAEVTF